MKPDPVRDKKRWLKRKISKKSSWKVMECKFLGFALGEDSETNRLKKVDLVSSLPISVHPYTQIIIFMA